jgi:RHS repeat-associated protein
MRRSVALILAVFFSVALHGDPSPRLQYVVHLTRPLASGALTALGATVDVSLDGAVIVTLPEKAVGALQRLPGVELVERYEPLKVRTPASAAIEPLDDTAVQYMVVVTKSIPPDDLKSLGARLDQSLNDVMVLTLPEQSVEALRRLPAVRYVQRVARPGDDAGRPRPESQESSARKTPTSLAAPTWDSQNYVYDGAGNIKSIGTDHTYTYDTASRLMSAAEGGQTQSYQYDEYGNLTAVTTAGTTQSFSISGATNQNTGDQGSITYDEAGNMITDNMMTYLYDGFSMMKDRKPSSGGATSHEYYVFNASDERIATLTRDYVWIWTLRDESGKVLREYKTLPDGMYTALWLANYVWRDGSLASAERVAEEGGRRYFHLDHLGSPRLITGAGGVQISTHDFYPFGRERTDMHQETLGGMREETMKFTGHERDFNGGTVASNTTYLDYMHARYYNPNLERFLSLDANVDMEKNLPEPQRWNRYAYVTNNPLKYLDPNGEERLQAYHFPRELGGLPPQTQGQIAVGTFKLAAMTAGALFGGEILPALGNSLREAGGTLLSWALGNLNGARQVADATLSPPGSSALPSVTSAISGDFERVLSTKAGAVTVLADASSKGSVLTLSNLAIYGEKAKVNPGAGAFLSAIKQLAIEAKAKGYTQIVLDGFRYSGTNAGTNRDIVIDVARWAKR